jgi:hypothetical protein
MNHNGIIVRETAISLLINLILSVVFFVVVFGLNSPVPLDALAPDFFPQSFMVALMGSLVPALLLRRKVGGAARPILLRALIIALVAVVIAGGSAFLICQANGVKLLDPLHALAIKAVFGGALAVLTTPFAVRAALRNATEAA